MAKKPKSWPDENQWAFDFNAPSPTEIPPVNQEIDQVVSATDDILDNQRQPVSLGKHGDIEFWYFPKESSFDKFWRNSKWDLEWTATIVLKLKYKVWDAVIEKEYKVDYFFRPKEELKRRKNIHRDPDEPEFYEHYEYSIPPKAGSMGPLMWRMKPDWIFLHPTPKSKIPAQKALDDRLFNWILKKIREVVLDKNKNPKLR